MRHKRTHAITVIVWLVGLVTYVYAQNNPISIVLTLGFFLFLSYRGFVIEWRNLLLTWLFLSIGFVTFYALFAHIGDQVLFVIPGSLSLISGIVTLNAIFYGLLISATITLGVYSFAIFSLFFQHQQVRFYFPGILGNLSILFSFLSHFTQFFFRHRQNFEEKIFNRGMKLSKIEWVKLFIHDSFFFAVEHSISYAEIIDLRGFATRRSDVYKASDIRFVVLLIGIFFTLLFFRVFHAPLLIGILCVLTVLIFLQLKKHRSGSVVASSYFYRLETFEWLTVLWSILFVFFTIQQLQAQSNYLVQVKLDSYLPQIGFVHLLFFFHCLVFMRLRVR